MDELIELLKDKAMDASIISRGKFIYWSDKEKEWVVLRIRNRNLFYSGDSLTEAIKALRES